MLNIILTLVFSIVMLVFMAFPAIKIVDFLETKISFSQTTKNVMLITTTITLSLLIGLFIRFA